MQVKLGLFGQPCLHVWVFAGGVVVQYQVDLKPCGNVVVDRSEELQELDVAVLGQARTDHLAGGDCARMVN